jgi:hypothetical protein
MAYRQPGSAADEQNIRRQSHDQMAPAASGVNMGGNVVYAMASSTATTASYGSVTGVSSGTKFQLPELVKDAMVYLNVATATNLTSVTIGPVTGAEATIFAATTGSAKSDETFRVPAGWFVIITATAIADVAITYVTC